MMKKALFTLLFAFLLLPNWANAQLATIITEEAKACDTYTWQRNGKVYTKSAVDTCKVSDTKFYVLNLVVYNTVRTTETVTASCEYTWHGQVYLSSRNGANAVKDTLRTSNNCDSIVTLQLNITKQNYDTTVVRSCNDYTFRGRTYTATGTYNDRVSRNEALSCDSTHVLVFTKESRVQRVQNVEQCAQFTWNINGVTYTESANVNVNIDKAEVASAVCDSLIMLNFVKTNYYDTAVASGCAEYKHPRTKKMLTATGLYNDTTTTTNKCSTIHTINLTIVDPKVSKDSLYESACTAYYHSFVKQSGRVITIYDSVTKKTTNMKETLINATVLHNSLIVATYSSHKSAASCFDSTMTIHVNIRNTNHVVNSVTACDQYRWKPVNSKDSVIYNRLFSASGKDSVAVGKNVSGCDSMLVVEVTINNSPVISAIEGKYKMLDGEQVRLYGVCDQDDVKYAWYYDGSKKSSQDTLVASDFTKNTDVTLIATNTKTNCADTSWITVLYGVGIDKVSDVSVSLYPNPVTQNLTINCGEAVREVVVYNMAGVPVYSSKVGGACHTMNLASLSNGSYVARIAFESGKEAVRNFIVKK